MATKVKAPYAKTCRSCFYFNLSFIVIWLESEMLFRMGVLSGTKYG